MRALDQEVAQEPYGPKGQSSGVANTRLVALATNLTGCYFCPSDSTEEKRPSDERSWSSEGRQEQHMVTCGRALLLEIRDG